MSYQKTATKCSLKARKLELKMKTNELKFRQCGEQRNKDNASNHYENDIPEKTMGTRERKDRKLNLKLINKLCNTVVWGLYKRNASYIIYNHENEITQKLPIKLPLQIEVIGLRDEHKQDLFLSVY